MKHTEHDKGPWDVLFDDDGAWVVGKPDERETRGDYSLAYSEIHIARVYHLEANARLIAAAPALVEASEVALIGLLNDGSEAWRQTAIRELRYALKLAGVKEIARVEGEGGGYERGY